MKAIFSLFFIAAASLIPAQASLQAWASGVNIDSGWIDYEKTYTKGDGDDNLCWAASTSNVLDYWQSLYVTSSTIPTGKDIWQRYKEAVTSDMGGNFISAAQWWIGGDYSGVTLLNDNEADESTYDDNRAFFLLEPEESAITTDLTSFGGYYWELIPNTYNGQASPDSKYQHLGDFFWAVYENHDLYDFSTALVVCLNNGTPSSLSIVDSNKQLAHAITLWGAEYSVEDGKAIISSLWITDSDDYTHQLREISTYTKDGENRLYLSGYSSYSGYGDIYIAEAYGLNTAESDTWALQRIPEPATTTLSLAALAALCARRRRK